MKHIVTSGCSFSEKGSRSWPHHLSDVLDITVYKLGLSSAGNHWIAKSAIHQVHKLLSEGVSPDDISVIIMWSGIDRKDLFISSTGTPNYRDLISVSWGPNPVNFIDQPEDVVYKSNLTDGYLVGTPHCNFENKHIQRVKQELAVNYFSDEAMAIESYENFLRVQWFCESKKIKLMNMTFMDIMYYPLYNPSYNTLQNNVLTKDLYRNIAPLYDMIDFNNWLFWKETGGLYEYTRDNNLTFEQDEIHPTVHSHEYFVENFLMKALLERKLI